MTRARLPLILLVLALVAGGIPLHAQDAPADPLITRPYRDAVLYAGPGDTFLQVDIVRAGTDVQIVERNQIGNWLHVARWNPDGSALLDGWVMTGYLSLDPALRFSLVPVNEDIADADVNMVRDPRLAELYAAPVISPISPEMREVFEYGAERGMLPNIVTKVGDSVTADPLYLAPLMRSDNVLGPYDYLADTVDFYGDDMAFESVAARIGMTSYVIFDPAWADPSQCEPNETPLDCEYRIRKPSVAMIMFGANDVRHIRVEAFDENMRDIVDVTLQHGVIPVLSTFTYDQNGAYWEPAVDFNLAIVRIADDYSIPLINLWSAARILPGYGLDGDDVHMAHSGFRFLKFDTGHESWYGVPLRNLLSIRMLEKIRTELEIR